MMRASLVTEGTSDQVLVPILRWLLGALTEHPVELVWADLRGLRRRPKSLREKVKCSLELYPCDFLFVHRDSDGVSREERLAEIMTATGSSTVVPVIPVRMQEAWLLFDEAALRRAAGKPTGRTPLELPKLSHVEGIADPKTLLNECLQRASQTTGRRAKRFRPAKAVHRMANIIVDWSPLRQLESFRRLEEDLRATLRRIC